MPILLICIEQNPRPCPILLRIFPNPIVRGGRVHRSFPGRTDIRKQMPCSSRDGIPLVGDQSCHGKLVIPTKKCRKAVARIKFHGSSFFSIALTPSVRIHGAFQCRNSFSHSMVYGRRICSTEHGDEVSIPCSSIGKWTECLRQDGFTSWYPPRLDWIPRSGYMPFHAWSNYRLPSRNRIVSKKQSGGFPSRRTSFPGFPVLVKQM